MIEEAVEAVVDSRASASVVGKHQVCELVVWKRARKVKIRQEDESLLGENYIVNTTYKIMHSSLLFSKFVIDAEVFDIGHRNYILGLSWLAENGFLVDMHHRCLRNVNSGQVIPCSVRCIPEVLIMEEEAVVDGEILLIINTSEQYACYTLYFSAKKAARLLKHKS